MRRLAGWIAAAVALSAAAGALGGWAGVRYGLHQAAPTHDQGLDAVVHHQLGLTPDQDRRIERLERDFAARRGLHEAQMRQANRDLAAALAARHAYGPEAEAAIARFHHAMAQLQTETVQHVLAMRAVLTPDQAARFDRTVSQVLAPTTP